MIDRLTMFPLIADLTVSDAYVLVGAALAIFVLIGSSVRAMNYAQQRLARWRSNHLYWIIRRHFRLAKIDALIVTQREFPGRIQADLQSAIEGIIQSSRLVLASGVPTEYEIYGISLAQVLDDTDRQVSPIRFDEVAIGEEQPLRCFRNGIWLLMRDGVRFALFLFKKLNHCSTPEMLVAVAAPDTPEAKELTASIFGDCEAAVRKATAYRGKVLSLESDDSYMGESVGIKVHCVRSVEREQVILPERTVELIERNVLDFVDKRERLRELGQPTRKGLLFYGPPGNGKTHLIHYLINRLAGHTTLLIGAEQVARLGEYMTLARLLQPSIVVLEDVDLIALDRGSLQSPLQESLLNKLLNEMDGLTEAADILFILTTNRPESLEDALASRPGRIDQAVEFPLPDALGRRKLVDLYSRGFAIGNNLVTEIVQRTEHASAAFIKELMRRSVQYHIGRNGANELEFEDVRQALDELLTSGPLAKRLLGFATNGQSENRSDWRILR
jgi:cell division protease FtsH